MASLYHHNADNGERWASSASGQHPTDMVWRTPESQRRTGEEQARLGRAAVRRGREHKQRLLVGVSESERTADDRIDQRRDDAAPARSA